MTREEAAAILESEAEYLYSQDEPYNREAFRMAIEALKVEPKHGKWMPYEFGNEHWHKCSVCGKADEYINDLGLVAVRNYCPNCGCDMRESTMGQLKQEGGVNDGEV